MLQAIKKLESWNCKCKWPRTAISRCWCEELPHTSVPYVGRSHSNWLGAWYRNPQSYTKADEEIRELILQVATAVSYQCSKEVDCISNHNQVTMIIDRCVMADYTSTEGCFKNGSDDTIKFFYPMSHGFAVNFLVYIRPFERYGWKFGPRGGETPNVRRFGNMNP